MLNKVNRASQFMPFDALSGFSDALRQIEKAKEDRKVLSIDQEEYLNQQFQMIQVGDSLEISFYNQTEYVYMVGVVQKIQFYHKWMVVSNTKIAFQDVFSLKKLENSGKM